MSNPEDKDERARQIERDFQTSIERVVQRERERLHVSTPPIQSESDLSNSDQAEATSVDLIDFAGSDNEDLFQSPNESFVMANDDPNPAPPATSGGATGSTSTPSVQQAGTNPPSVQVKVEPVQAVQQLNEMLTGMSHDTIERRRQQMQQELQTKKESEEFIRDLKAAWVSLDVMADENPTYYSETKQVLKKLMDGFNIKMTQPTLVDEMRALAKDRKDDSKGVVSKIAHRIKQFTGTEEDYTWEMFKLKLNIVATNANYQDSEMKAILFQSLEGNALAHFQANEEEYMLLTYQELLKKFGDRYGLKIQKVIENLVNSPQASNEDVRTYCDKLKNLARPLLPTAVPQKKIIYGEDGTEQFIRNPFYEEELKDYNNKKEQHEMYLVTFFVKGLRPEIIQKMSDLKFDKLADAMKEAIRTEENLNTAKQLHSNNVQVNAVSNPLSEMDKRGSYQSRSKSPKRDMKPGTCHLCGKPGHWRNECPRSREMNKPREFRPSRDRSGSRSRQGSRQSSRDRSGSYTPQEGSRSGSSLYGVVNNLSRKLDQLSESFGRMRVRSRSRSRESRRDRFYRRGSRSRSHSRSRSQSGFRRNSRSRSGSRQRPEGYHSRSGSRDRSQSRSPKRFRSGDRSKNGPRQ
jgi:hypothetical protein